MEWVALPLRRYSDYSGRSRRREFWIFHLFFTLASLAGAGIDGALNMGELFVVAGPAGMLVLLALLTPSFAVSIRRLHDTERSGWWLLVAFVPILGVLGLICLFALEGTRGPNRYGADPAAREAGSQPEAA